MSGRMVLVLGCAHSQHSAAAALLKGLDGAAASAGVADDLTLHLHAAGSGGEAQDGQ